ncbi:hypothetical protein [Glaciihabitans tibetensis]|uniref:hypothetical protein n=1 Tax=Glaciihabitans tibetensis TaxID=1266600 RepID=UPI0011B2996D|nr:hypothetical protein [Glaciihabitans tibetensis]
MTLFQNDPPWGPDTRRRPPSVAPAVTLVVLVTALLGVMTWALMLDRPLALVMPEPVLAPYTMPEEIAQIADRMGLSEEGRAIFVAARPQLLDDVDFLRVCGDSDHGGDGGESAPIGCYFGSSRVSGGDGEIAVYRVPDPRLANRAVAVAAHELLHAAYDNMPADARGPLDALLEARWSLVPPDDPIQTRFRNSVGPDTDNRSTEQFAYIGSEIFHDIDPELESYFARYFSDRSAVPAALAADDAMWEGLKAELAAASDTLMEQEVAAMAASSRLQNDRARLDNDRATYNMQVEEYNARTPEERTRWSVINPDGSSTGLGEHLAATLATFPVREAELAARQVEVDAATAAAASVREEVDRKYAEVNALGELYLPDMD